MENVETYRNSTLVDRLNSYYNKEGNTNVRIIPHVDSLSIVCTAIQKVGSLLKAITALKNQLDDCEMLDDNVQEERNVDISHEAASIYYIASKLIRRDFAHLKKTRLQKSAEDKQNENDEDFNLNISQETALKHTTK